MTDLHPITPPPELTDKWNNLPLRTEKIFVIAARWGSDQELEACVKWFDNQTLVYHRDLEHTLLAARRPKPPSLKEQALKALNKSFEDNKVTYLDSSIIRRALEALPND